MPTTIRKVVFTKAGGPEVVQVVNDTLQDPPKGEVQVKVVYSGFGGSDINMRNGTYTLQPVPAGLDLKAACALILDWTTAYGMVHRSSKFQANDKVFVHGLSGAVGRAVFILCKLQGAEIYGTASASKHAQLKAEGTTEVFDYRNKDWIQSMLSVGGANMVFDPLGFDSYDESFAILNRDRGVLIGYGATPQLVGNKTSHKNPFVDQGKLYAKNLCSSHRHTTFFYVDRDQKTFVPELQALQQLLADGKIDVSIKKLMTIQQVPSVHAAWTKLQGVGSCLVDMEMENEKA